MEFISLMLLCLLSASKFGGSGRLSTPRLPRNLVIRLRFISWDLLVQMINQFITDLCGTPFYENSPYSDFHPSLSRIPNSLMMLASFTNAFITGIVGWVLWRICQKIFVGSPLDKIPGPQPDSFLTGKSFSVWFAVFTSSAFVGILGRLFTGDTWDFHKDMLATCT